MTGPQPGQSRGHYTALPALHLRPTPAEKMLYCKFECNLLVGPPAWPRPAEDGASSPGHGPGCWLRVPALGQPGPVPLARLPALTPPCVAALRKCCYCRHYGCLHRQQAPEAAPGGTEGGTEGVTLARTQGPTPHTGANTARQPKLGPGEAVCYSAPAGRSGGARPALSAQPVAASPCQPSLKPPTRLASAGRTSDSQMSPILSEFVKKSVGTFISEV